MRTTLPRVVVLAAFLACVGEATPTDEPVKRDTPDAASADGSDASLSPGKRDGGETHETGDAGAQVDASSPRDAGQPGMDASLGSDAGSERPDASTSGPDIWHPAPGTTWQWQLNQPVDGTVAVAMYDVDLFETPAATIEALQASGRVVICYFSAGSREDWRPDADQFASTDVGNDLDGWPGEKWVRITSAGVRDIMKARLALAVSKGCDGVEPDNVDGYANSNGLGLTAADQLDYNRFLAGEAHARGLSVGLKNDLDQTNQLVGDFDWALNEECLSYDECTLLRPFIEAGKAVFHVEYVDRREDGQAKADQVCGDSALSGFSTLVKTWELDAWRIACP